MNPPHASYLVWQPVHHDDIENVIDQRHAIIGAVRLEEGLHGLCDELLKGLVIRNAVGSGVGRREVPEVVKNELRPILERAAAERASTRTRDA